MTDEAVDFEVEKYRDKLASALLIGINNFIDQIDCPTNAIRNGDGNTDFKMLIAVGPNTPNTNSRSIA